MVDRKHGSVAQMNLDKRKDCSYGSKESLTDVGEQTNDSAGRRSSLDVYCNAGGVGIRKRGSK